MIRSILNIAIVVFVIWSLYAIAKNNNVPELASQYFTKWSSQVQSLSNDLPKTLSDIQNSAGNFLKVGNSGLFGTTGSTPAAAQPAANIVLPGPLTKITDTTSPDQLSGALTVPGIISGTNSERLKQNEIGLTESTELDASAKVKALDILGRQYFEHTAPDGKTVSDLVKAQGYTYIKIGENLALGTFKSDADVVAAWMASPGHRENILDPQFSQIGVGVAHGMYQGHMVYVAVQHFGRPSSACPTVDAALKAQVATGQTELTNLANSLDQLKNEIDQGRAQNQNMSSTITIYNQGVEKYQTEYAQVDVLRAKYNAEVSAFNVCIATP